MRFASTSLREVVWRSPQEQRNPWPSSAPRSLAETAKKVKLGLEAIVALLSPARPGWVVAVDCTV
jgi:hypothetical protein